MPDFLPFIKSLHYFGKDENNVSGPCLASYWAIWVGRQHKDLTAVWLVNGLCMLFPQAYLTENKHVLAFLVRYPVDRLFIVSCHVHFIQVFSETKKIYVSQMICDKCTILALKYVITYTFPYMQIVHHYTYLWIRFHTISEQDSLFVYQYVHLHRDNW